MTNSFQITQVKDIFWHNGKCDFEDFYVTFVTEKKYFLKSPSFQENSLFILTFYKLKSSGTSSLYGNVASESAFFLLALSHWKA